MTEFMPSVTLGQMVLANRLTDGQVVFLAADGTWVEHIGDGALTLDRALAAQLLATAQEAERENLVVEPYLIDIREGVGVRQPVSFRESIRVNGPTVRTDLLD